MLKGQQRSMDVPAIQVVLLKNHETNDVLLNHVYVH